MLAKNEKLMKKANSIEIYDIKTNTPSLDATEKKVDDLRTK